MNGEVQHRSEVSLVTTILNEATSLPLFLTSIYRQTRVPDEIIVVDGGSTDGSVQLLRTWQSSLPLTIVVADGASISEGRNIGIARASGEVIAITDAGTVLDADWLHSLVSPFEQPGLEIDVSSGFFHPDPRSSFEAALAATTLPDKDQIDPETFLPSSRSVAFRKSWFDADLRYPEWLDYCEDLVFDLRLKRAGARFHFVPEASVAFRPRTDLGGFWNQYYRYARGDGKAGLFWKRHLIRYLTYLIIAPSVVVLRPPIWRLVVLAGALAYIRQPVKRLWARSGQSAATTLKLAPLAAVLRGVGDIAKMAGYPVGLIWRARRYGLRRNWQSIPEQ